jgi:hypothetical protein
VSPSKTGDTSFHQQSHTLFHIITNAEDKTTSPPNQNIMAVTTSTIETPIATTHATPANKWGHRPRPLLQPIVHPMQFQPNQHHITS